MTTKSKVFLGILFGGLATAGIGAIGFALSRKRSDAQLLDENTALGKAIESVKAGGMTLKHHRSAMPIKERVRYLQDMIALSVKDPEMIKLNRQITKNCAPRDKKCEAKACFDWTKSHIRYTGDIGAHVFRDANGKMIKEPEPVDLFATSKRVIEFGGGDCLPIDTLVLRGDYELVPLVDIKAGDRIMSDDTWTTVQELWLTGEKQLLSFHLNNGCTLRCTPEHRIFRVAKNGVEEIRAEEAKPGDTLYTPSKIQTAEKSSELLTIPNLTDEEIHWLLGAYVADGWVQDYRFAISGLDGKKKEEQKRRVQALMERAGIHTRWNLKYIMINDSHLAKFVEPLGHHATQKHVPTLAVTENEARALLEGLKADASDRTDEGGSLVYGTTSPRLALELRILLRMIGRSTHIQRVDKHGGFGSHPIYRITARQTEEAYKKQRKAARKYVKIKAIELSGTAMCCDLTTSTGKFWLPESDVIVHNCDEHLVVNATCALHNGMDARIRTTANEKTGPDTHVYAMTNVSYPPDKGDNWLAMDTTLPYGGLGTEHPHAKATDWPA